MIITIINIIKMIITIIIIISTYIICCSIASFHSNASIKLSVARINLLSDGLLRLFSATAPPPAATATPITAKKGIRPTPYNSKHIYCIYEYHSHHLSTYNSPHLSTCHFIIYQPSINLQ